MKRDSTTLDFMKQVSTLYQITSSLQKTARESGISYAKVRKILITLGEYETEFSREVIIRYMKGKSIMEIADDMGTSANRVNAFLPYKKALYMGPVQSADSHKSKLYRSRVQVALEKFVSNKGKKHAENDLEDHKENTLNERKEISMKTKSNYKNENLSPVHLHLELDGEFLDDSQKRMLRRYGESTKGDSISRDILIPSDMPLHNLHYVVQRLFGWQNSHLRCFRLPADIYSRLTGDKVKGWADLVGILFQPPSEYENDMFWDDDYNKGSIKSWLKNKYTGPYVYGGEMENLDFAQKDMNDLLQRYQMMDVHESFNDYYVRRKNDGNAKEKILRRAPMIELTLEEMNSSLLLESGTDNLLERIEVTSILAAKEEQLATSGIFPVTQELLYNYDYGDNWIVKITKEINCNDLLKNGYISEEELLEAQETVLAEHRPVCIHKDGVNVMDDVGGLGGFADFLKTIYEDEDKEEQAESKTWARSLGWSSRKASNKMML